MAVGVRAAHLYVSVSPSGVCEWQWGYELLTCTSLSHPQVCSVVRCVSGSGGTSCSPVRLCLTLRCVCVAVGVRAAHLYVSVSPSGVQRGEVCEWQWGYELFTCTSLSHPQVCSVVRCVSGSGGTSCSPVRLCLTLRCAAW